MNFLQVPQRWPLWRQLPISRAFFYMSLKFLIKVILIKRDFTLLSKALGKKHPKMGPLWKQMLISRAVLNISFRFPSKGALPPGSSHRAATERDASFLEPPFIHLSKSLVNEPFSSFLSWAAMERDACLQSLPLHKFQGPQ